ncbi:ABC transporter substrate-binding protein [Amphibacillus sediminis]|uniref:ABC transporter substrate-binding protein n=1 Tax=Amphibacillus sediminis TaxID=360185 RepID=UPI000829B4CE|nr:ABC transporter substrate-binding protein [Amphibacillus sediminis]
MKRILMLFVLLLLLAACGSEGASSSSEETVTIYMAVLDNDPSGAVSAARDRFNEEHEHLEVEFVTLSNDASEAHSQIVTQLTAQSRLDIVNMDVIWVAEFAEAGWLMPLDDRFTVEKQGNFLQGQVEAMYYDDHIWGVPWLNDMHPLWYREDLLNEYGYQVPETYQESIEIIHAIQEFEDINGFSMHWGRGEQLIVSFTEFLQANNGDFFDDNGQVIINQPEAVEALQFMVDMISDYQVVSQSAIENITPEEARIPFTQGQAIFNQNWGYVYSLNQQDDSPVKDLTWIANNPSFEGGRSANAVGGWNYGIASYTDHPDEAWEVIEWFTSFELQKEISLGGQLGTNLAIYEDEEIVEANPYINEYLEAAQYPAIRPIHPEYSQISDMAQFHIHTALLGEVSAQEALDNLANEIEQLN